MAPSTESKALTRSEMSPNRDEPSGMATVNDSRAGAAVGVEVSSGAAGVVLFVVVMSSPLLLAVGPNVAKVGAAVGAKLGPDDSKRRRVELAGPALSTVTSTMSVSFTPGVSKAKTSLNAAMSLSVTAEACKPVTVMVATTLATSLLVGTALGTLVASDRYRRPSLEAVVVGP